MKGEFVMLSKFISSLKQEFGGYNAAALTKDLMAGLTVAAVALPLALAFGVSSGADAASGLITAIIAGLIMSLLSGGYYQISGPTGAMAAILGSADRNLRHAGHVRGNLSCRCAAHPCGCAAPRQPDRLRTRAGYHRFYLGYCGHHRDGSDRQLLRHALGRGQCDCEDHLV